ncbi:hypothetical protein BJ138DRAFT_1117062 [Hygrophoropsis aurantiaca]|uniref:Uncharacterized protein n=1 Tax=Hygrophoropsis aurantiaca TaxID=72124 RepID=A0ACB8A202_9AGAM|nr:hypothetical protein BJ138DRAFT_1117062 [Hygrophoropsis aurantiaca]
MSSTFAFPSPVGGVSLPSDLGSSVFFVLLHASLLPVLVWRISNSNSRAILSMSSMIGILERMIIFSLRSVQSHDDALRVRKGLLIYVQSTLGGTYIWIAMDVVTLARCLMVNSTKGPITQDTPHNDPSASPFSTEAPPSSTSHFVNGDVSVDQPRNRKFYRRFTDFWRLLYFAAAIPGIIAGIRYYSSTTNPTTADYVMALRYASSGIALLCNIFSAGVVAWIATNIPGIRRGQIIYLLAILACGASTAIYRLAFMYNRATSFTSTAPGSGNTAAEKAAFYIFHILSDWGAIALMLVPNVRRWFNTGLLGDYRSSDPPHELAAQELVKTRTNNNAV